MKGEQSGIPALVLQRGRVCLCYLALALLLEWLTFSVIFQASAFPSAFWMDLVPMLAVAILLFLLPSAGECVVGCLFLAFQTALGIANHAFYQVSETVVTLDMLSLLGEATGVVGDFLDFGVIALFVVCGLVACGLFLFCTLFRRRKISWSQSTILALVVSIVLTSGVMGVLQNIHASASEEDILSQSYVYDTLYNPLAGYRYFGTYGYYTRQLSAYCAEAIAPTSYSEAELSAYLAAGEDSAKTYDSDYTGLLAGQNLILIVIESGEWAAINKEYTPTLYAMATQGTAFTQFYGKNKTNVSEELSLLGAYHRTPSASLAGSALPQSLVSVLRSAGYETNYFHANNGSFYQRRTIFEEAFGFDHVYFLEDMPFLGKSKNHKFAELASDNRMMRGMADEFSSTERPFFTMMMSLTSHGGYTSLLDYGKDYADMTESEQAEYAAFSLVKGQEIYFDRIDGYPETFVADTYAISETNSTPEKYLIYKRYQAGICDLDAGVNALLCDLAAKGTLENTAFFFYSDHSAYYNQMNYYAKDADVRVSAAHDSSLYRIPCFFWSGKTDLSVENPGWEEYESICHRGQAGRGALTVSKYCNTLDILPTLLQLFGYSYNKNLYQGVSVFSAEYSLFVSKESGVFDDRQYFDGLRVYREAVLSAPPKDQAYTSCDLKERYRQYLEKQAYIDALYASDYFALHSTG